MILIDMSQIMMAAVNARLAPLKNVPITEDMIRYICLDSIRINVNKFKVKYGEVVIACDGSDYWRKTEFPYYKANRSNDRKKSILDYKTIYKHFETFKIELREYFPYRVIEVDTAEADDIIGTLCYKYGVEGVGGRPIMIVSGDHDFKQLHKFWNVEQWSPTRKKKITINDPDNYLFEHIVRGDSGDGVPNVFSDDDTLITKGKRQKVCTASRLEALKSTQKETWADDVKSKFDRNQKLIDLGQIPQTLKDEITAAYNNEGGRGRGGLFNYFVQFKLKNLLQHINQF